ncbi:hypothetical protein [Acetobacter pasteurianus]|uniref:Uncharacterized protein n=1 Tax=Acetobacter pasteurianus NBRC 3278 TaxID=1226660 RepID=A0A401X8C8_ACEPA|nr:hypothetical protein [Acetobacter pasteurianus]GCD60677.1 hypothetical protein NBRC3277_3252 [Acetobacter pasteurianus NBRC 3277]GCD64130.1 hypothetical protein NBRC3278_3223 [Acetobacter pasteurianus NBRC 3278]
MPLSRDQIRQLIGMLGETGARIGLENSFYTAKDLRNIANSMGLNLPAKATKKIIISEIILKVSQRIDKPIEELLRMSSSELLSYFEKVKPKKEELLKILSELDFHPGSEYQKSLYKYAARQISETGMFQRVASSA